MNTNETTEQEYSPPFKKMVVLDLLTSDSTVKLIAEKYNLPHFNTVTAWKRQMQREFGEDLITILSENASPLLRDQVNQAGKKNSQLQKALNDAHLKIVALETLIELAEKEFKIAIRKKPGTKQ